MENYSYADAFLKELNAEIPATRKCLERIPENLFDYKPHEKSMTLGYLALLVAEIPEWIQYVIKKMVRLISQHSHIFSQNNTAELVTHFDENIEKAKML